MPRFVPAAVPAAFAAGWIAVLAALTVPAVIDGRLILLIVFVGVAIVTLETTPLVAPRFREWGLGAGILAAMLAPFGMGVSVLALFTYRAGDLGPGWERSGSVIPALVVQALAAGVVVYGLVAQRAGAAPALHRRGRWLVIAGTVIGVSTLASHLLLVAFDAAATP